MIDFRSIHISSNDPIPFLLVVGWRGWEGSPRGRGSMYAYGWFTSETSTIWSNYILIKKKKRTWKMFANKRDISFLFIIFLFIASTLERPRKRRRIVNHSPPATMQPLPVTIAEKRRHALNDIKYWYLNRTGLSSLIFESEQKLQGASKILHDMRKEDR